MSIIREIRTFADENGSRVTAFYKIDPETMDTDFGNVGFGGTTMIMTSKGPMHFDFEFPDEYTLKKCFEDFQVVAEKSMEEKMKEIQEKQRIVTPNQVKNSGNIIIP